MNWVEVVWPLVMSMSLVFGLVHLLVWRTRQGEWVHLALAVAAFSLGALTSLERLMLSSESTVQTGVLIHWMHVPVAVMVVSLIVAVHLAFRHGSLWLAAVAIGLRLVALVLNFTTGVNLNFLSIDRITWATWWGVAIAQPVGQPNPGLVVALLSNLFLAAYLVQTLVRGLRVQPARRSTLVITCGACLLLVAVLIATTLAWAIPLPRVPLTLPSILALLLVIGWQLGEEFIRRSRLEGLLQKSELQRLEAVRELNLAAMSSGLGLWNWDATSRTFTQNCINRKLLGKPRHVAEPEADGSTLRLIVDDPASVLFAHVEPGEIRPLIERFEKAIRQPTYELDYAIRGPEGERQWICLRGSAEHDASGAVVRLRGMTQDVSRRRSEEKQLRAVLDASPTALLLVDSNGEIRYANEQGAVIFGYERGEMPGVRADQLLPLEIDVAAIDEHRQPARHGGPGADGLYGHARCGREFPVEVVLNPLEIDGHAHVVAAVSDLTERQRAEQEMAFERESMAHMSRVTLIGEISGSLAHELNQPLAAILSNAQAAQRILRRDPADVTDIREILDDIVENDRRAGEVIKRLRGLLKKECRAFTSLAMNEVVHDSIRIIRNDLVNRGVEYRLDLAVPICRVQGDPVQLQQVLLNLIVNACEAMGESTPREITVRTSTPNESRIQVEVRDTGPGIPEDMLDVIFAPFQTSKPNGMGMGLAICRTLIRAHGGRIWAANLRGGGASLCFELPMLE